MLVNFHGLQARYSRFIRQSAAWRLLRADNSVYILAYMEELFATENEVSFARARISLEANLELAREQGFWETETTASTYLRQWSDDGWFRDMDDKLSMTDDSEQALRFAKSLSHRGVSTSASHLRIVQDNVRDLSIKLSTNPKERIKRLEKQMLEIQIEIENLQAGRITMLSESQQREAMRELYQQASVLTGDFRRVEDDMRSMDQAMRVEMIQDGVTRGDILKGVLDYESRLAETESGSAFFGFHELLQDENRSMEFRQELQGVLNNPAAESLTKNQYMSLKHLIRNLNRESDSVLDVRRRHSQGLRSYIESGAAFESQAVNRLLGDLEKVAVSLRDVGLDPNTKTSLALPVGRIEISTPTALRLKLPEDKIDTSGVVEQDNQGTPSDAMLEAVQTVQVKKIARRTLDIVKKEGPLTIAGLAKFSPISKGLEELTALIRVAKAVKAVELLETDSVQFKDRHGIKLRATIPKLLISADLFPADIEDLNL